MEEIVRLENVWKIYENGFKVEALRGVNLKVFRGDFISIMGPSGSGKSTLLHILGLLDTPTKGKVIFLGKDVSEMREDERAEIRNKKIGFVFQSFNRENV